MTQKEDLLARLERANPIPDPSRLYPDPEESRQFSHLVKQRRDRMDDTKLRPVKTGEEPPRSSRRTLVAAALLVAVVGIGTGIVLLTGGDEGSDVASGPAATIDAYIDAYNDGNIDEIMALFTEQSVITGHPYNFLGVEGLEALKRLQELDLNSGATENAYTISNVGVSGNTVTWDHVWTRRDGNQACKQGHVAVVMDGKILSWAWGTGHACG